MSAKKTEEELFAEFERVVEMFAHYLVNPQTLRKPVEPLLQFDATLEVLRQKISRRFNVSLATDKDGQPILMAGQITWGDWVKKMQLRKVV